MNIKWTENIGKEFIKDSQLELKDSFGWYVPLHKLPTDPKMAMPRIADYKPQNITTDDFDKKDANHNKFNYKNTSHFKDILKSNNSLPDKQYEDKQYEDDLEKWFNK